VKVSVPNTSGNKRVNNSPTDSDRIAAVWNANYNIFTKIFAFISMCGNGIIFEFFDDMLVRSFTRSFSCYVCVCVWMNSRNPFQSLLRRFCW
jgi:hypothetical protein